MSHLNPGLISAYNSLTDKHLAGYFSSSRIRRHLQRAGLITRSGRIVPDKEYRQKLIQRAHQRHVRECLAQAIFHKVLEMERLHQIEIKRKLEEFARRERVHKIKVERSKRYEEEIIRILSPRPPSGARGIRKQHSGPEGEHTESSESPGSSRPNTAPGKMQRPVRLKPLHSNSTTASLRHSSPYRRHDPPNDNERPFNGTVDKESRRRLNTMEVRNGISPYCLPVINNFVTPVPPTTKRKERPVKVTTSGTLRGRRLRPTTASSGADNVNEDPPMLRSSVPQSRVCVNMVYLGKSVHLSNDLPDLRDEVRVFQQHCGGENLCVYKGKLREGESFQFISRRHRGFPFSLTFFLNGLQVERLSSCCEFKHRKSSRISGRHGHFAFSGVEAASPCYKCIIAMGLDKKPVPPPKRLREDAVKAGIVPRLKVTAEVDTETTKEEREECESTPIKDTEMTVKEDRPPEDRKIRDDYEEDFEADDEGPVEEEREKKSPRNETDERRKDKDASESEDTEKEDDIKSRSGSSFSSSDREESDAEEVKDAKVEDEAEKPEDAQEEVQEESHPADLEAAQATEVESAEAKDSEIQDSAGQSTEIEISDTGVPSGNENRAASDTQAAGEGERTDESKQEEPERAKSVQEKLAEAILKESHCSSEPELSDTSTETEEGSTNKSTGKETNVAETFAETSTEQQEVIEWKKKCEETVVIQEEVKIEDEMKEKPKEIAEDDTVQNDKVSEKAASEVAKDENTGEMDVSEEIVEDVRASDEPAEEAEKDGEETEQGAESVQEDESAVSELNNKPDETAEADNTEPSTAQTPKTMEMKAQVSDAQEAISCEEAPATDTQANDKDQASVENVEESQGNAKDEIISDSGKEEKESVVENAEREEEVLEDVGKTGRENVEEEQTDVNEDEKDTAQEQGRAENMETKPESENINEERAAEEAVTNLINTEGQERDEADKTQSEKDANEKPNEKLEKEDTDGSLKGDTSKEKSDGEDETNAAKDEEEGNQTESEVRKDEAENQKVGESEKQESILETVEGQETSEDKESVKLSEENVKPETLIAAEEAPKEMLNNVTESEELHKENSEKGEVDAENGEVSVVTETKQTVERGEDEQKEETEKATVENITKVGEIENEKLETNGQQKPELKEEGNNNVQDNISDVASGHSNQEEIIKPIEKDLNVTDKDNTESAQSESHTDKPSGERVVAVDIFAVENGDNGDTEEASKASEEGASVLLKPQVKSSLHEQKDEKAEQKGSPEGLTTADSADLVTNWVNLHQTSKYFETFVEPLEEIRDVNSEASNAQSLEPSRSESPVKMVVNGQATDADKGNTTENEAKDETSDLGSNKSEAKQDELAKDDVHSEESKVIFVPNAEEKERVKEPATGESVRSEEDKIDQSTEGEKVQDGQVQLNNNITRSSIAGSHLSVASGKPEVSENLNEGKASDHGKDLSVTENVTEVVLKTEELQGSSGDVKPSEPTNSEDAQDNSESKEVTVTTDLTVSKSDNGSQEESHKAQGGSINGDKTEIVQDTDRTLSKEHLSSFSVDDALFGRRAYPLLTATKAESGH